MSVIGVDVSWDSIEGMKLKYVRHISFAAFENNEVQAKDLTNPYALVVVDCSDLPEGTVLPITHKLDFYNLWWLEDNGLLHNDNIELYLIYKPGSGLKGAILPRVIFEVYDVGNDEPVSIYGNERKQGKF